MSIIDLEKWKKADIHRSSPYKSDNKNNPKQQRFKDVVNLRIKEILIKLN